MNDHFFPRVFVFSGPSGVGKSSIIQGVLSRVRGMTLSVSHTTRKPRPGEIDGVHYYFVTRETFDQMVTQGRFLEWAEVYANRYGTSKKHIRNTLNQRHHALMDVDTQGAASIRRVSKGATFIFIAPPSLEELARRLKNRGTESDEALALRLSKAQEELSHQDLYDYIIVNHELEASIDHVVDIVARECTQAVQFHSDDIDSPDIGNADNLEVVQAITEVLTRRLTPEIKRTIMGLLEDRVNHLVPEMVDDLARQAIKHIK